MIILQFFFIVLAYLIGSVPFAYLLVKMVKGIDIRSIGSGNVGATNAGRVLGTWGFVTVFILDFLKGFLPTLYAFSLWGQSGAVLAVALAIVLGHSYTVFLNFKGGKGVATAVGVYAAITPVSLFAALLVFAVMVTIFRMVSLGSLAGALALLAGVLVVEDWQGLSVVTVLLVIFIFWRHRTNISRIIAGTESKVGQKKDQGETEDDEEV